MNLMFAVYPIGPCAGSMCVWLRGSSGGRSSGEDMYIYICVHMRVQAINKKFLNKKFSIWHPDFLINFSRV